MPVEAENGTAGNDAPMPGWLAVAIEISYSFEKAAKMGARAFAARR
jgi:hypothetical protein